MTRTISKTLLTCGRLLTEHHLTIAFAESATAGRIAAEFALIPDAGKFLKGGIICYDACLKTSLLNVPEQLLQTYTPESAEVTHAIAVGLKDPIPADILIGCTGLTCPGGSETPEKPVGTMFICGIKDQAVLFAERIFYQGDPEQIIIQTVERTGKLLLQFLVNVLKEKKDQTK